MRTGSEIYNEKDMLLDNTWHSYLFDNIETHFFRTHSSHFEQAKFQNLECRRQSFKIKGIWANGKGPILDVKWGRFKVPFEAKKGTKMHLFERRGPLLIDFCSKKVPSSAIKVLFTPKGTFIVKKRHRLIRTKLLTRFVYIYVYIYVFSV